MQSYVIVTRTYGPTKNFQFHLLGKPLCEHSLLSLKLQLGKSYLYDGNIHHRTDLVCITIHHRTDLVCITILHGICRIDLDPKKTSRITRKNSAKSRKNPAKTIKIPQIQKRRILGVLVSCKCCGFTINSGLWWQQADFWHYFGKEKHNKGNQDA